MAVTEQGTGTETGSGGQSEQLRKAFEEGPSAFELLRGMRTRRVGLGYRIDSGTTEKHPVTGREMTQMEGPDEVRLREGRRTRSARSRRRSSPGPPAA